MVNSLTSPSDVGFAQFTAALITQTLDAVISAQLAQEERARRLQETAGMTPAQFAQEAITSEDLEAELARLFPSDQYPNGIRPGTAYISASTDKIEDPPVLSRTGYTMKAGDWVPQAGGLAITEAGYNNILTHMRLALAADRQVNLLQMLRRGIPRVIVDHGRVNAKLFFQFASGTEAPKLGTAILPRLAVTPVELRRPEVSRLTVNVVGEVDITFKTISE